MNRQEFMGTLRCELSKLPPEEIADATEFYEEYFDEVLENTDTEGLNEEEANAKRDKAEAELIQERFDRQGYFAQNYDSPYLFYPILRPHGASLSGLMTLSDEYISKRLRRSLPIESGFMKRS